jgi:ABC-type microcin C transport system duplicated ATPase subunit YejF
MYVDGTGLSPSEPVLCPILTLLLHVDDTGAGKSTTVQVLFRLLEPTRGDIVIDGVSVLELGLHDLRKKLSVIPQVRRSRLMKEGLRAHDVSSHGTSSRERVSLGLSHPDDVRCFDLRVSGAVPLLGHGA